MTNLTIHCRQLEDEFILLTENQKSKGFRTKLSTTRLKLIVAPQFPALPILSEILKNSSIALSARIKPSRFAASGAYTGEVSPALY